MTTLPVIFVFSWHLFCVGAHGNVVRSSMLRASVLGYTGFYFLLGRRAINTAVCVMTWVVFATASKSAGWTHKRRGLCHEADFVIWLMLKDAKTACAAVCIVQAPDMNISIRYAAVAINIERVYYIQDNKSRISLVCLSIQLPLLWYHTMLL